MRDSLSCLRKHGGHGEAGAHAQGARAPWRARRRQMCTRYIASVHLCEEALGARRLESEPKPAECVPPPREREKHDIAGLTWHEIGGGCTAASISSRHLRFPDLLCYGAGYASACAGAVRCGGSKIHHEARQEQALPHARARSRDRMTTLRLRSLGRDFREIAPLLTNPTAPRLPPTITHSLRPLNYHHNHIAPTCTPDP